jgi:polar amino acid transport system substrate-binding protein
MHSTHRKAVVSAAALIMVGALAGCAGGASGSAGAPADSTPTAAVDTAAAAALPAQYKENGIKFASDIANPPMEFYNDDQEIQGFDFDLMNELGARLGTEVSMNQQAWDTIIPSLQSNKWDAIIAGMNDTEEREAVLDFVDYFYGGFGILVQKGNPDGIKAAADLCGKKVAVQKATVQGEVLTERAKDCPAGTTITLVELPSELDSQTALRAGQASAEVVDAYVAAYAAQTAGDGQFFELISDPESPAGLNPVYTGIGVLKKSDGLAAALQLALQSVIDDGTYEKLLSKWNLADFAIDKAGLNLATTGD